MASFTTALSVFGRDSVRVGIDVTCWANRRGFGRFVRELVGAILKLDTGDEWVLFADRQSAESTRFPSGCTLVVGDTEVSPTQAAAADGRRSLRDMWAMRRAAQRVPLDLFFFPAVYSYFPLAGRVPCIVTFHDTIADTLPQLVFHNRRSRWFWRAKCRLAQRRASAILTVSEASKTSLIQHFRMRPDSVYVMHEAASEPFGDVDTTSSQHMAILDKYDLASPTRFLLYVGGISPHKNLGTLIDAFARTIQDPTTANVRLVLVGDYAGDVFRTCHADLLARARAVGIEERVIFPGYVPDDDLAHLYAASTAFVFPSYLEGFGLPAVEAMACGAPVLASDRGSLPEVLDGAGLLFDPDQADAMAEVILRVLKVVAVRDDLAARSQARAKHFSWEQSARRVVDIVRKVVP